MKKKSVATDMPAKMDVDTINVVIFKIHFLEHSRERKVIELHGLVVYTSTSMYIPV